MRPDLVLFDQNYQFDEIAQLRESGVRTIGRFVWEHFADEHVEPAGRAFDRIYSLTACEQERYAGMGIETPRVRWGCFPDLVLLAWKANAKRSAAARHVPPPRQPGRPDGADADRSSSPAASCRSASPSPPRSRRSAGRRDPRLRLILKAQVQRQRKQVARMIRGGSRIGRRDRRIEVITSDLPTDDYLRMFAAADVCLAPSRWEGLGLHLFEATALGVPVITNDNPPMNEVVLDGVNGILVPGIPDGRAPRSGIPAYAPNLPALTAAIEALADDGLRAALAAGARRRREELSWERTTADLAALIRSEASG